MLDPAGGTSSSVTVTTADPVSGHFHYHPIAPVTLAVGQHFTVAGLHPGSGFVDLSVRGQVTAAGIHHDGPRSVLATALTCPPSDLDGGFGGGKFGGSLEVVPVPEPSALARVGLAAGRTCRRCRRPQ
ncbi:MAG TPA: hypothetical protein VGF55_21685 [Gemmataceae bacterium]